MMPALTSDREDIYTNPTVSPQRVLDAPAADAHFMVTQRGWSLEWFFAGTKWGTKDAVEGIKAICEGFNGSLREACEAAESCGFVRRSN